ncbi:unnamed protein product [Linum tenue]|uniref:Disease resistance N-terminal domain-containing protein n=1 Tax=Linum tenue TaxID=586396 RepID=A0AAV0PT19_9ROSI|nr:unnamed protein product [Linum tenue]CAI0473868.1 unnamed protein product [Linum tenue]
MLDEKAIFDAAKDGAQKLGKAVMPILQDSAKLLFGLKKELENLNYTIRSIEAVVKDAEQKQKPLSNQDRDWVEKLSGVMKEGFDLLRSYWERSQKQAAIINGDYFNCVNLANYAVSYPYHLWADFRTAGKIKDIRERLDACAKDRRMFQLRV